MLTDDRIEEIINDPEDLQRIVKAIRVMNLKKGAAQAVDLFDEDDLEEYSSQLEQAREDVLNGHIDDIRGWITANEMDELRAFLNSALNLDRMTLGEIRARFESYIDHQVCPHGEPLGDCTACDVAGDLAYDAAREDRP